MKIDIRTLKVTLIMVTFSLLFCSVLPYYHLNDDTENTLFTVSGIMFSIGLGLTVVSNTHDVKNKIYIREIRKHMAYCQSRFITLFLLQTIFYICLGYTDNLKTFNLGKLTFILNFRLAFAITSVYTIIYFVIVFRSIQRFNDELEDRINKEEAGKSNIYSI